MDAALLFAIAFILWRLFTAKVDKYYVCTITCQTDSARQQVGNLAQLIKEKKWRCTPKAWGAVYSDDQNRNIGVNVKVFDDLEAARSHIDFVRPYLTGISAAPGFTQVQCCAIRLSRFSQKAPPFHQLKEGRMIKGFPAEGGWVDATSQGSECTGL